MVFSPGAPAGDAHALDDVDAELTDVHEEEHKEAEGAVAPAQAGEGEGGETGSERRLISNCVVAAFSAKLT